MTEQLGEWMGMLLDLGCKTKTMNKSRQQELDDVGAHCVPDFLSFSLIRIIDLFSPILGICVCVSCERWHPWSSLLQEEEEENLWTLSLSGKGRYNRWRKARRRKKQISSLSQCLTSMCWSHCVCSPKSRQPSSLLMSAWDGLIHLTYYQGKYARRRPQYWQFSSHTYLDVVTFTCIYKLLVIFHNNQSQ